MGYRVIPLFVHTLSPNLSITSSFSGLPAFSPMYELQNRLAWSHSQRVQLNASLQQLPLLATMRLPHRRLLREDSVVTTRCEKGQLLFRKRRAEGRFEKPERQGADLTRCLAHSSRAFQTDVISRASISQDRIGGRRSVVCEAWTSDRTPYETLDVERSASEEDVKGAYRRMAKRFHPDVYKEGNEDDELAEGETPESRFIQIQAAYELLMNPEERRRYDIDHRENPLKASRAWVEWVLKKKRAFEQRGDLAVSAWAEQQQREMSLRARNLSKAKMDPEEERRLVERQRQASMQSFETTIKRHNLVLRKRDLMRQKADEDAKARLVRELLAAEGFEVDDS
eukprot:TRINITY_DN26649_c0_g1_i1.p1 TRINITY_DN26649_c0_g1~~TRINITY_DN26649_c0_g1_i1.p1  ORF type:complete len:340 (-),score=58.82 TRINITY_DN26649_c0_g1_i1:502-1521(-)